jgi:quinol monooxygenase YgiN
MKLQGLGYQTYAVGSEDRLLIGTFLARRRGVVFSIIRIFTSPKQHNQVIELLRTVQDLTRPAAGCLGCWLSEEDYLHNHIRYAEQWDSEESLNGHIRSDLYRRVLAALELSKQSPEVAFYYTQKAGGLEVIEALRGPSKGQPSFPAQQMS